MKYQGILQLRILFLIRLKVSEGGTLVTMPIKNILLQK
jgi:hypothetical protein